MKLLFQMIKSMNTVCFVCKLQHFLKNTLFQYITASTNINFCTYKFLFCSENWVRRRRKKHTRKKDIYVVIYAKHKIFVDKMFNIFVRHSQYNVSLPYLTKIRKAMRQLTTILKVSCKLKQATLNMFFFSLIVFKISKVTYKCSASSNLFLFMFLFIYFFSIFSLDVHQEHAISDL